jgi:hypothetical protein
MTAVKIDEGHFGEVDLSGLAFCAMFAWPRAVHLGNGEVLAVISEQANEAQGNTLLTILSGKETAPGATIFNVFGPTFAKMHDAVFAPIECYLDPEKRIGRVRIPGILDTSVEPIRNPTTGDEHRVSVNRLTGSNIIRRNTSAGAQEVTGPLS